MKACVLESIGNLVYKDVPMPQLKKGEVLLKIKACGICSSDIDRVYKTGTYHFPTIPGHEFSGEIVNVGDDVDTCLIGKRATVFPLLPCFECPSCEIGAYARCQKYSYFGSRCDGAFAEYIAVPVWNLVLCSDDISFETAALCEPTAVAIHAINASEIKLGNSVLVIGNGTIGLLAALCAKIYGAKKVIVVGRSKEKLEFANELGLTDTVSILDVDAEKKIFELTDEIGADVTIELVGSSEAIDMAISCTKRGGKLVLTGNPHDSIGLKRETYWKILRNELRISGTWNSVYNSNENDWKTAIHYMESGQLPVEKLVTHKFNLSECEKAFSILKDKTEVAIKVMFKMD